MNLIGIKNSKSKKENIDYSKKYTHTSDWDIMRTIDEFLRVGIKPYLSSVSNISDFDRMEQLDTIKIPVLIIHGKKDSVFSVKNSLQLSGKIKNLTLVILENSNHILVIMNFERVSKEIEKFIDKVFTQS